MVPLAMSTAAVGAGLVIVGAGIGVGLLWAAGLQSIARQPEMQTKLQAVMLIGAALIEGTALFALVICLMTK
jgi:F-type H+-transporting ATPase subunit c